MGNTITENKKYRPGLVITETIVDGDIFKITEEYKDDKGEVVYIREYYPTPKELIKAYTKNKKKFKRK